MNAINMEYNSQKEELTISEYGRNIQEMIKYAKTIEKDDLRQAFIERIVDLMLQMAPQSRNMEDYRDKLWKHVFRIAEYDLKVMPPNGEIPTQDEALKRPEMIPYPISQARYRHYGHNVQVLIKKALEMEQGGEKQAGFIRTILSYMKLAYRTWNKEHYVSDDVIKNDLKTLSNGMLELSEDESITNLTNNQNNNNRRNNSGGRGKRNNNYKNRSKGGGRNRKNKN